MVDLESRFTGSLLGLLIGDAFGGQVEGCRADHIARVFPGVRSIVNEASTETLHYTDDTQMAIALAEHLVEAGSVDEDALAAAFARRFEPWRGYGGGARLVLRAIAEGGDHRAIAATTFPGGSYGNGAAMRVAPVGLLFHDDPERLAVEAAVSARPTHVHPMGIDGAVVLALAVGQLTAGGELDREALVAGCRSEEFGDRVGRALDVRTRFDLVALGNGIAALESVPTAIGCYLRNRGDVVDALEQAIRLGGDTDTIAAMTGALVGAALGEGALPAAALARIEDGPDSGRTFLAGLARRLAAAWRRRTA